MAAVNEKISRFTTARMGEGIRGTVYPARVERVICSRDHPSEDCVRNPETELRPGMFATAQIDGPETRTALFVPEDALQDVNGNQVVFTTDDGETFKAQIVKLGTRTKGKAEVVEGLKRVTTWW